MQSLFHSSPVEGDQDTLQPHSPILNGTYITHPDGADIPFNSWPQFNTSSHTSELHEKVQTLGDLRLLPQDMAMDNATPLARFVNDRTSSALVDIDNLSGLNNGHHAHHTMHLSIATSWDGYQRSFHDSADASSTVSSPYEYPYSTGEATSSWNGSPEENHFHDVNYDTSGTSPSFPRDRHSCGGSHSHKSSIDSIGCLPSSPGINGTQHWRSASGFSADSNAESASAVAPLSATSNHHLSQDEFVSLKSIQLSPANEEKDEDDSIQGRLASHRPHNNSVPGILVNGREHSGHERGHEHDGHTSPWDHPQSQYYLMDPIEVECASPSPPTSPQVSPRSTTLEAKVERRSRSGSGASQLSAKARVDIMKPYKDTITISAGKSAKGRGAGKKAKGGQFCPEHPNKMFRHNSDFRKHMQTKHTRPFLCTFYFANCNHAFGSKNEWKRHVFSQHLQLIFWRCDFPECADRKATFNRKDLFGQHLKRMHRPQHTKSSQEMGGVWQSQEIPRIQERCLKERRKPPQWSRCGYCKKEFSGEGSWDARMEHVGKHYEKNNYKGIDPKAWIMDEGLIQWSLEAKIVEKTEDGGYKLLCHGKNSIDGEDRRKSQVEPMTLDDDDELDDEDAEGENENDF